MKRAIAWMFVWLCAVGILIFPSKASAYAERDETETYITVNYESKQVWLLHEFTDGSILYEGKIETLDCTRGGVTSQRSYYYQNSSGNVLWTATVIGTFTYNGRTSSCTSASCRTTIYDSAWSEESCDAHTSGSSAVGSVVMLRKWLFFTLESVPVTITLTCDKNGNLS